MCRWCVVMLILAVVGAAIIIGASSPFGKVIEPGITAAVTNVERGRSNPLYEFFKSGVAMWGRQHQRAVDAAGAKR